MASPGENVGRPSTKSVAPSRPKYIDIKPQYRDSTPRSGENSSPGVRDHSPSGGNNNSKGPTKGIGTTRDNPRGSTGGKSSIDKANPRGDVDSSPKSNSPTVSIAKPRTTTRDIVTSPRGGTGSPTVKVGTTRTRTADLTASTNGKSAFLGTSGHTSAIANFNDIHSIRTKHSSGGHDGSGHHFDDGHHDGHHFDGHHSHHDSCFYPSYGYWHGAYPYSYYYTRGIYSWAPYYGYGCGYGSGFGFSIGFSSYNSFFGFSYSDAHYCHPYYDCSWYSCRPHYFHSWSYCGPRYVTYYPSYYSDPWWAYNCDYGYYRPSYVTNNYYGDSSYPSAPSDYSSSEYHDYSWMGDSNTSNDDDEYTWLEDQGASAGATAPATGFSRVEVWTKPATEATVDQGWEQFAAGDAHEARRIFQRLSDSSAEAGSAKPNNGVADIGVAIASAKLERWDEAVVALRRAARNDSAAFNKVPSDKAVVETIQAMLDHYKADAKINANDVDALFMTAALQYLLGDDATAYFTIDSALEHGDKDESAGQLKRLIRAALDKAASERPQPAPTPSGTAPSTPQSQPAEKGNVPF